MVSRQYLLIFKSFVALLVISSLISEIVTLSNRGVFNFANFFSYFTVLSNTIAAASLVLSILVLLNLVRFKIDGLRYAATLYILIVGIGFSLLLSGLEGTAFTAVPWNNTVLHYIVPVALLIDIILDKPRRAITRPVAALWFIFPVAYILYTLIRGAITDWYPYPFLDPASGGYVKVFVITVLLLLLGAFIVFMLSKVNAVGKRNAKS